MITTVLFDLDGTLSDSAPGILGSLRAAFSEFDVPWLSEGEARAILGPPFWQTLPPLVGADRVAAVIASYRRHYVELGGMYETARYDGIAEVLAGLSDAGLRLAVATSKPEVHAVEIVAHLDIVTHFEFVAGDTLDGARDSKALVLGEALRRLGDPDPESVLMVGDRSHDVVGATAHGVRCIGALWGYGSPDELTQAGAFALCERPAELWKLIA